MRKGQRRQYFDNYIHGLTHTLIYLGAKNTCVYARVYIRPISHTYMYSDFLYEKLFRTISTSINTSMCKEWLKYFLKISIQSSILDWHLWSELPKCFSSCQKSMLKTVQWFFILKSQTKYNRVEISNQGIGSGFQLFHFSESLTPFDSVRCRMKHRNELTLIHSMLGKLLFQNFQILCCFQ